MSEIKMLPLPEDAVEWLRQYGVANTAFQMEVIEGWFQAHARAVAEHNVSRALAESDHSLRTENAGLALALEQAEANVKARDAEIEALRESLDWTVEQNDRLLDEGRELTARAERLAEALQWYAEQAEGCRKIGSIGEPFRKELDRDGGKRARAALRDHDQEAGDA